MRDSVYLKKMVALSEMLELRASAEPFSQDNFHKVVVEMQSLHNVWNRSRRRRPWFVILFCFLLFCLLYLIVFVIIL